MEREIGKYKSGRGNAALFHSIKRISSVPTIVMRSTETESAGKEHPECRNFLVSAEMRVVPVPRSVAKVEDLTAAPFILWEKGHVLVMLPSLASTSGLKAVHATGGTHWVKPGVQGCRLPPVQEGAEQALVLMSCS